MPFKSDKQRKYLFANEPEIAKRWSNMYNKIKGLGAVKKKGYKKENNSEADLRKLWKANKISAEEYFTRSKARELKIPTYKITGLGAVKPTISEIKRKTLDKAPYFFSKDTMKFFGQRMSDYKVKRSPKGKIFIYAATYDSRGNKMPYTFREFKNNDLISSTKMFESESDIKKYISKN